MPYVAYLFCLRQSFDRLCEKYVDIVLDKDGMYSVIDSVCDQPIFFLISQAEDFSDFSRRKCSEDRAETEDKMKNLSIESINEKVDRVEDSLTTKKPFLFSDFGSLSPSETKTDRDDNESKKDNADVATSIVTSEDVSDDKSIQGDDDVESVYMMASSRSIDCVVEEYMKRKKSCSMLPRSGYAVKKTLSTFDGNGATTIGNVEPLPPEIEQQRKSSLHKVRVKYYYNNL